MSNNCSNCGQPLTEGKAYCTTCGWSAKTKKGFIDSSGGVWIVAIVAIILFWLVSSPARSTNDPTSFEEKKVATVPPPIVVSTDACPFEGCQLGKWVARELVPVYDSVDGKLKRSLRQGESVYSTLAEVRAVPRKAIVTKIYRTDKEQGIDVGSRIYVLHPIGEGAVAVWIKGKVINGSLDLEFRYEEPLSSQALKWTWWVYVRLANGTTGWLKNPQGKFEGMDALG